MGKVKKFFSTFCKWNGEIEQVLYHFLLVERRKWKSIFSLSASGKEVTEQRITQHFIWMITPYHPIEILYLELRITQHFKLNDQPPLSYRNIIPGAESDKTFQTELSPPLYPIEISYLELRVTKHFQLNDHPPPSNRNIIPGAESHKTFPTEYRRT